MHRDHEGSNPMLINIQGSRSPLKYLCQYFKFSCIIPPKLILNKWNKGIMMKYFTSNTKKCIFVKIPWKRTCSFTKVALLTYLQLFHVGSVTKSIFEHSCAQNRSGNKCNCIKCVKIVFVLLITYRSTSIH